MTQEQSGEEEIKLFWSRLTDTAHFEDTRIIFTDAVDLFREALLCYQSNCYMAVALQCRSVLESALYCLAIAEDIRFLDRRSGKPIVQVGISTDYVEIARCYGQFKDKAYCKFNIRKFNRNIERVRELGNFSAHYSQRVHEKFARQREKRQRGDQGLGDVMLWIGRNEARQLLEMTLSVMLAFQEVPYSRAIAFKPKTSN